MASNAKIKWLALIASLMGCSIDQKNHDTSNSSDKVKQEENGRSSESQSNTSTEVLADESNPSSSSTPAPIPIESPIWTCTDDSGARVVEVTGQLNDWGDKNFKLGNTYGSVALLESESQLLSTRSLFCGSLTGPGMKNSYSLLSMFASTTKTPVNDTVFGQFYVFNDFAGAKDCPQVSFDNGAGILKPDQFIPLSCKKHEPEQPANLRDVSGGVDSSFGIDGILNIEISDKQNPRQVFAGKDSSYIVTGECDKFAVGVWTVDTRGQSIQFENCLQVPNTSGQSWDNLTIESSKMDPEGKFILYYFATETAYQQNGILVAKYLLNEKRWDMTFGNKGTVKIGETDQNFMFPTSGLAISKTNDIYLGGVIYKQVGDLYESRSKVLKLRADGSIDQNFANRFGAANVSSVPADKILLEESDGKLLISGGSGYGGGHFAQGFIGASRFLMDGSIDTKFGRGGHFKRDAGYCHGPVSDLMKTSHLKYLIATGCNTDFAVRQPIQLIQMTAEGKDDTTFNSGSTKFLSEDRIYNWPGRNSSYENLAVQINDQLIFTGLQRGIVSGAELVSFAGIDLAGRPFGAFGRQGFSIIRLSDSSKSSSSSVMAIVDQQKRLIRKSITAVGDKRFLKLVRMY